MDQLTFSEAEFHHKKRKTRREKFLEQMDELIPWKRLEKKIARHYPKPGNGRRPYPLSTMLRVHCMQLFYNLSDPAMEDALYEIESMRRFAGLSLSGPLPDESTILKFRHLLEKNKLGKEILKEVNLHLEREGLLLREGTIVDATIISAPTSTKNQSGKRDPEMHQTRKGNEWHFGMKMHIGVDETFGVIHSLETTPANTHDITQAEHLLHGQEDTCWGDAGYLGVDKREELADKNIEWYIAARPGKRKKMSNVELVLEKNKASVRAKVEHPFRRIKQQFGYSKVRYRGLEKNNNRLQVLAAFSNLLTCKNMLPA
jgi:IS5 family transposase